MSVQVMIDESMVHMRDSKDPQGPVLTFTKAEWNAFVLGAKDGEFDLPPYMLDDAMMTDLENS